MKSSSANSPSFDKIASAFPSASPLILLFLHYIRRSFDPLSRLCRSFHRFSHPFTIQVKSFACKSRSSRSASQYPVAFAIMHFSSNSLSPSSPPLSPRFLIPQTRDASRQGAPQNPSNHSRRATVLVENPLVSAKPRLSFQTFHLSLPQLARRRMNFESGWNHPLRPAVETGQGREEDLDKGASP